MDREFEQWATLIEHDGLIVAEDGSLRFTSKRKAALTELFGLAGIDIRSIKTKGQYLEARNEAGPFFRQWLEIQARKGTMTLERQLLVAIAGGDEVRIKKLKKQVERSRNQGAR